LKRAGGNEVKVKAWNNGKHHHSGAGFGLKISATDRDCYFKKSWNSVFVLLPNGKKVEVNTKKASFWNDSCRELISKEIGVWLIASQKAPWQSGSPPSFNLKPTSERHFVLEYDEA
jgi:hypothetical protein